MDNSTQHNDEWLVRYLDNDLNPGEKEEMEKKLAGDDSLQARFEELRLARELVRHYGLRSKVAGVHRELMNEMRTPVRNISSPKRVLRYSMSIAAGILLLVGAFLAYNFFSLSSEKVYSNMYQGYEVSTVRGNIKDNDILKAYREKNYKEVVKLYGTGIDSTLTSTFLAAMSSMELNDLTSAIASLEVILERNRNAGSPVFEDETEFYLVLAYIRNRDYDLAIPIMEKIKNDPDHLYNDRIDGKDIRKVKMLKWR